MLQQPTRFTLVEQVARQLETLIESGEWPVGSRIPAEPELMTQLQVSRNTLREAIRALIHAGLLKTRQGDGTYVRSASALGTLMQKRLLRSDLLQTLEVRHALEREAAFLAASRRNSEDIEAIRAHWSACQKAVEQQDRQTYIAADIQLHQAIVAASHNDILLELYKHISTALQQSVTYVVELSNQKMHDEFHQQLVEAIIAQNADKAVEAVHFYIKQARSDLENHLEETS
ncbi:FadR/GntR family transcriptional regulator [Paenibacillus nasutitermitis]|uniref:GntR family transcriptional regulator n=1 Tax=Paenibacillus nasutitermitis TaxID=1652958 RepID=A0A917E2N3_9BACL|nr:FadR/GntR family transcriptional regulator [Paenibacillus nasutitermitis]GGD95099.1 GntR family transcriptional regulator [Paenibacillus nasutitermitis]